MDKQVKLRKSRQEDILAVIAWIPDEKACRIWAGPGLRFPFSQDQLLEDIGFERYETYSLVDGQDNPIGIGQIMHRNDRLHLGRILIAPSQTGSGIWRLLCEALIRKAKTVTEIKHLVSMFTGTNKTAIKLYRKLGFTIADDQSQAATHDSIFMILEQTI